MTLLCLTAHVDRAWPVESHLQKKKKISSVIDLLPTMGQNQY